MGDKGNVRKDLHGDQREHVHDVRLQGTWGDRQGQGWPPVLRSSETLESVVSIPTPRSELNVKATEDNANGSRGEMGQGDEAGSLGAPEIA